MSLSALFEDRTGGTAEQVQSILRAVRRHLAMDVGFISEFIDGDRVVRYSDGEVMRNPLPVGARDPLEKSFCHYVAKGLMPGLILDANQHPVAAGLPLTQSLPVGSYLSVPLHNPDGVSFGTVCCFSFKPDHSLTARDLGVLRLCADVVGAALQKERQRDIDLASRRARIATAIERQSLHVVYQPIYRTADGRLAAFEALARFSGEPYRPPDAWFAEAASVGRGKDLELLALRLAVAALGELDPGIKLTANLSPAYVESPRLAEALRDVPLDRLVLELTENAAVADYAPLRTALAPLRAAGLRLAIDDVGAGHSSFRHVLDLAPEFIKLDKSLIHGIDTDTSRRALAAAITRYSRDIGCQVVAEGVETVTEYGVLRDLGVTRVQGYLTGRPMQLAEALQLSMNNDCISFTPQK